jgi:uncharacterized protein YgiM (DUF1202 family)
MKDLFRKKRLFFQLFLAFHISLLFAQSEIKTTEVNLNLRKAPFIENNVIIVIPKGSLFTVDYSNQQYSDWILIKYKGYTGYVFAKYISSPPINNDYVNFSNSAVKYYINSQGEKIQSPTYYNSPPTGSTAQCRDGTYSFSRNRRGTCSHHGGVKRWL